MANASLAHPIDSMKLEAIQDELSITLEQIHALVLVSLDESFLDHSKRVRYAYLSVVQALSEKSMSFSRSLLSEQGEGLSKKLKADEQSESP